MTPTTTTAPSPARLTRSLREPRTLRSALLSLGTAVVTILACTPLFSTLLLLWRGGAALSWRVFVDLPPTAFEDGGGFGNAIVGTLVMVGLAAGISAPMGILAAVFLAEFGPESRTASAVRFCAKTLTGLPSILAGVFAYAAVVLVTGTYSAPAGSVALAILMLPTVLLTAEEAMKRVPSRMQEAAVGLGCTRTQVVWRVVLPTALPGMLTGVILAVARAAGETAPLLFTALFSNYWLLQDGTPAIMGPTASLAVLIYNFNLYYGKFLAVRDSHIPIERGKITAFIGPSGCGKSTALRCLNRMNDLVRGFRFEGHVHFQGEDIYAPKVDPVIVRRYIGMVFQQPNPFAMSIFNNVAFGLQINRYKGNVAERVEQALHGAALWDEVKDKLKQSGLSLSRGQQQRLCIARAIATEPAVLLMDEPCSALDPIATRRIEELMQELKQRYTIAVVTHNLHQAIRSFRVSTCCCSRAVMP